MSARRKFAGLLYRRQIGLFDSLNKNVLFSSFLGSTLQSAKSFNRRIDFYAYLNELLACPIDYLEFGVWKGESISNWSSLNQCLNSRFFGFDTFEGLPEDWTALLRRGAFSTDGKIPNSNDERIRFVSGLFQKSLRPFLKEFAPWNRLVVHIDSDLYSSALFALSSLDGLLVPGSIVIFDEFYDLQNEFAAWLDYSRSFYRDARGLAFTTGYVQTALEML
jgi:O-methyltransferase